MDNIQKYQTIVEYLERKIDGMIDMNSTYPNPGLFDKHIEGLEFALDDAKSLLEWAKEKAKENK